MDDKKKLGECGKEIEGSASTCSAPPSVEHEVRNSLHGAMVNLEVLIIRIKPEDEERLGPFARSAMEQLEKASAQFEALRRAGPREAVLGG